MPTFLQQYLQILCATTLVACGGGGSSDVSVSSTQTQSAPPPTASTPSYAHSMPANSSIKFRTAPDVSVHNAVGQLNLDWCTLSHIQHVITLDLNDDLQDDLLMHVLCGSPDVEFPDPDTEHDAPFRNTLVAVLSQSDGSYAVDNNYLFGKNDAQVGGDVGGVAGFFTPLENPNGGLPIISYIVSRDDFQRKYKSDFSNVTSYQGVLTPNWDGKYEITELSEVPIWAQGVLGIPNNQSSWDLLYGQWKSNWRDDSVNAHRYDYIDGWADVSDEYYNDDVKYSMGQHPYMQALDSVNHTPFGEVKYLTVDFAAAGDGDGLTVYELQGGFPRVFAEWDMYENMEVHQWGSYDEPGCGRREIVVHNGRPYFGGLGWDHFELWWPTPDSGPKLLAFGAAKTTPNGEMYDPNKEYTCEDEMIGVTFLAMFSLDNGRLYMDESPWDTEIIEGGGVLKQTIDINDDGYMDYFAANGWGYDVLPRVWINDKNGKLVETSTDSLPVIQDYRVCDNNNVCLDLDKESTLADMNNDGIIDLVQWHTGTVVPDLHSYLYNQGVDANAFKHQSGYINIWYGFYE